jgi:uncharacterized protein
MHNLINWFEIPVSDLSRAAEFYKTILATTIHETEMFGTKMGLFPSDDQHVSGALVQGDEYKPSAEGVLVYLNGGEDLSLVLNRIPGAGGTILVPKTQISPEYGFMALFMDTEGNKIALHSRN